MNKKPFIRHTHVACEGCREMFANSKTKEEAIAFAKKYLDNRKEDYTKFHTFFQDEVSGIDIDDANEALERTWKIATEYVLYDIIPHLYGDALD